LFPVFVPTIFSTDFIFGVSTFIFVIEVSVDEIIFLVVFVPFYVATFVKKNIVNNKIVIFIVSVKFIFFIFLILFLKLNIL